MTLRVVAKGTWLYAGEVATPVDIVALDYDWDYEFDSAEGRLEVGQEPEPLAADGWLYYARFRHATELTEPTWPDTAGYVTIEAAMRAAEGKVSGPISWTTSNGTSKSE